MGVLTAASMVETSMWVPLPDCCRRNSAAITATAPLRAAVISICCRAVPMGGWLAEPVTA